MALHESALIRLLNTFRMTSANGSLIMLGKQMINIEWGHFMKTVGKFGFSYKKEIYEQIKDQYPIDSYQLFRMFGFQEVHAMDISDHEGADFVFDLNLPVTEDLKGRFDVILDGGTTEHVFNVPEAMKTISHMLKKEGIVVHSQPMAGYVDHGFYSFSPTFYHDYYTHNGFLPLIEEVEFIMEQDVKSSSNKWKSLYSADYRLFNYWNDENDLNGYVKHVLRDSSIGRVLLWFIAKKKEDREEYTFPMQGMYREIYAKTD